MTNATPLQPFNFAAGMTIRALRTPEGAPWFIATDVAQALGYRDAANMTRLLDDDEKGTQIVSTIRGNQSVTTISESGLYSAIFSSSKAEAKAFKKWVTGTVLPSLRKNDAYAVGAEYLSQATQAALYKEIRGKVNAALRLHDRATEHDHFKSPRKQAERSLEASREVAAATGLPLAVVIATASYGGVKGAEVLALLTAP